jgi:uncharacterized protein (DUF302 family)
MATSEHQTPVKHIVVEATQPYERVIQAFEAQIGREKSEKFTDVVQSSRTLEDFTHGIGRLLGSSGFMEFYSIDHGQWFSPYFQPLKAKLYDIGNPLIAQHFLKYSAEAGLHVPIRVEIYENAQGKTCIGYDQPSTLLQQSAVTQEEFVRTATELDQKAAHLVQKAATVQEG